MAAKKSGEKKLSLKNPAGTAKKTTGEKKSGETAVKKTRAAAKKSGEKKLSPREIAQQMAEQQRLAQGEAMRDSEARAREEAEHAERQRVAEEEARRLRKEQEEKAALDAEQARQKAEEALAAQLAEQEKQRKIREAEDAKRNAAEEVRKQEEREKRAAKENEELERQRQEALLDVAKRENYEEEAETRFHIQSRERGAGGGGRNERGGKRGGGRDSDDRRSGAGSRGGKGGNKRERKGGKFEKPVAPVSREVRIPETITVGELAQKMSVKAGELIKVMMKLGSMVTINQVLDQETAALVAEEMGHQYILIKENDLEAQVMAEADEDAGNIIQRAPVVTIMGHVDHGKTSLLDYIRKTKVVAGEAGGITQHIGAYGVTLENGRKVTFLDTPGHEAFTAMRARGAQVTDIVIIIIAADDSVMPTTKEAIAHAQAAGVPMVFAINKIDKPGANPDKIREDLSQMNLLVEEWGGKYQCQEISAKKGIGVNELLDKVLLEADMMDLKANPNRKATGTIIESSLDKGRGYVSTVLVSNGTLKIGDNVIAGTSWGRIKAMFNERNQRIESAGPAEPAIILGLNGAPTAGDTFHVMETEQEAREIANKREQLQREQGLRTQTRLTLSDISHRIARGEFHEMNIIVKGDTDGSIEALSDSFIKLSTEKVNVNVISKAVGQISENDVMLASASDAVIVGFQVRPSADARRLADREGVEINTYSVIYDAIDDVKSTMVGMLDKVKKEIVTGQFEVKQVFKISKVGTVAGGMVTEGKVHSKDKGRVVRDGIVIHTAPIDALKRYKDDVKEVATGLECGISLVNYNDLQVGDIIETFTEIEVEQKL